MQVKKTTYTGNTMTNTTTMKMIKCTHHHFLKCAFRRAPKLGLAIEEPVGDSTAETPVLSVDMMVENACGRAHTIFDRVRQSMSAGRPDFSNITGLSDGEGDLCWRNEVGKSCPFSSSVSALTYLDHSLN